MTTSQPLTTSDLLNADPKTPYLRIKYFIQNLNI